MCFEAHHLHHRVFAPFDECASKAARDIALSATEIHARKTAQSAKVPGFVRLSRVSLLRSIAIRASLEIRLAERGEV